MTVTSDVPSVEQLTTTLGVLRERLDNGWVLLSHRQLDLAWMAEALPRWTILADRYLDGLVELACMSRRTLESNCDALVERLERGWLMEPTPRVSQEEIDEQFTRLLHRYEAICDVLIGPLKIAHQYARKYTVISGKSDWQPRLIIQRERTGGTR